MTDWFRRTSWSHRDAADFEARLARARPSNRSQYLRIQAVHLAEAGIHEHAIELFRRVVDEYPASLDVAPALSGLGRSLLQRGSVTESLDALRRCIAREREFASVRTHAWLDFSFTVARLNLAEIYDEASSTLEEGNRQDGGSMLFPIQRFMLHAARAIMMAAKADPHAVVEARAAIREASLTTSGLRYHSGLGLVPDRFGDVLERLQGIS